MRDDEGALLGHHSAEGGICTRPVPRSGSSASLGRGVPWGLVSHGLLTVTRACLSGTGAAARTDGWHLPAKPTSTVPEPLNASQSRP